MDVKLEMNLRPHARAAGMSMLGGFRSIGSDVDFLVFDRDVGIGPPLFLDYSGKLGA